MRTVTELKQDIVSLGALNPEEMKSKTLELLTEFNEFSAANGIPDVDDVVAVLKEKVDASMFDTMDPKLIPVVAMRIIMRQVGHVVSVAALQPEWATFCGFWHNSLAKYHLN